MAISGSGTTSVTLDGTIAQLQNLLDGNSSATIVYHAINTPSANTTLTLHIDDLGHTGGGSLTDNDIATLDITAENDDPSHTGGLPSDILVTEDTPGGINLSAIDLLDADAASGTLTLALSTSTGGTLSASSSGGVTAGGSGTGNLTLNGTLNALNAFIDTPTSIQYLSAPQRNR